MGTVLSFRSIIGRSRMLQFFGFALIALTSAACRPVRVASSAPHSDEITSRDMDRFQVPGLGLTVLENGRIGPTRTYGVRSRESLEPVTERTVFEACSLSKPVFAYAVMSLVAEGRLDLDRPLISYVPQGYLEREFFRAEIGDERVRGITARMVLSHRTGFPNWRDDAGLSLLFDPGLKFGYSGEGYVLLQTVVERLTGIPLQDFARRRVFEPLGMTDSSFVWDDGLEALAASPHSSSGEVRRHRKRTKANAAGSLYTTAPDFARFLLALLDGPGLSDKLRAEMLAKQTPVSPGIDWGLGVGLETSGGAESIWHWGDNPGFKCFFLVSRQERRGFVYFSNSDSGLALAWDLTSRLAGPGHPILDSTLLAQYKPPELVRARKNPGAQALEPRTPQENVP